MHNSLLLFRNVETRYKSRKETLIEQQNLFLYSMALIQGMLKFKDLKQMLKTKSYLMEIIQRYLLGVYKLNGAAQLTKDPPSKTLSLDKIHLTLTLIRPGKADMPFQSKKNLISEKSTIRFKFTQRILKCKEK